MKHVSFLTSNRFWALVIMAVAILLGDYGVLPLEVVDALVLVCGGHTAIKSWDRASEYLGGKRKK